MRHSSSVLQQHIIHPVRKALDYYTEMEKALERETQNWAQSENTAKSKESSVGAQSAADSQADAVTADVKRPVVDGTSKS